MTETTIRNVVGCDSCVGCGACGVATSGRISIQLGPTRTYQANLDGVSDDDLALGSSVCPFADESEDEDAVAARLYPELPVDPRAGRHRSGYAGRITDDSDITGSSSGGLTSYLLTQLLERGLVDGVIHVGASGDRDGHTDPIFEYVVSSSVDEVHGRRKSQYYPVTFESVIRSIRGDGRRYAFVGIPCVITALRHLTRQDEVLRDQLAFLVGIVCGHLKSMAYPESFAWQLGVAPDELAAVDFRVKDPERTSREYGFAATTHDGRREEAKTLSLVGGSWGHAVFQLGACDFCDDVFAESADVVLGDAWLAKYEIDWRGTNVVLTRDATIDAVFREGRERGDIELDDLSLDSVAATQGGNFRHRRDGLAVRLKDDQDAGLWTPTKRVEPSHDVVDAERVELIRRRREISRVSHDAFAQAVEQRSLDVYLGRLRPLIEAYQQRTAMPFSTRVRNKLKRETWKVVGRVKSRGKGRA